MSIIYVNEFTKRALTENEGLKLREQISKYWDDDTVIIDFSGISMFATMFFNASIGHYVLNFSPEICEKKIELRSISELGKETYKHSFENAKAIFLNKERNDTIGNITKENIEQA